MHQKVKLHDCLPIRRVQAVIVWDQLVALLAQLDEGRHPIVPTLEHIPNKFGRERGRALCALFLHGQKSYEQQFCVEATI